MRHLGLQPFLVFGLLQLHRLLKAGLEVFLPTAKHPVVWDAQVETNGLIPLPDHDPRHIPIAHVTFGDG